jgi:hypothetical protein
MRSRRGQVFGRHEVGAGGQRLPDLDEGGAERLEVGDESLRLALGHRRAFALHGVGGGGVDRGGVEDAGVAVLQQEARDLGDAGGVGHGVHAGKVSSHETCRGVNPF